MPLVGTASLFSWISAVSVKKLPAYVVPPLTCCARYASSLPLEI